MSDRNFHHYETSDDVCLDDDFFEVKQHDKVKRLDKRRRIEDLLEKKRLRSEMADYDETVIDRTTYYSDDIFDEY